MKRNGIFRPMKNRSEIELLFKSGNKTYIRNLLLISLINHFGDHTNKIHYVVSVPKRKFPLATQRNRIKRKMREALWACQLDASLRNSNLGLAFIFLGTHESDFKELSELFALALQKIQEPECREESKQ